MAQPISSKKVVRRNLKLLFWGDKGTHKTEEILRFFPDIFLIDAEGNASMCVDNPDIPEFILLQTKDPREAAEWLEKVAAGKVKFDDGRPVQTVGIDGWSVLWNVQKEFANDMAEARAKKYKRDAETSNATQLDWGLAKRPLNTLMNIMENSPFKYLVLTSREAPMYDPKNENVKIGERPDAVKGTEYEVNLSLQFVMEGGTWSYKVSKVQGTLGTIFPMGSTGKKIDFKKLFKYAESIQPSVGAIKSETQLAQEQVADQGHTKEALTEYGKSKGLSLQAMGVALKAANFSGIDLTRWDEMIAAIDSAIVPVHE